MTGKSLIAIVGALIVITPLAAHAQPADGRAVEIGGGRVASAFTISFAYTDRFKAQAVVRELVTKFTESNVTVPSRATRRSPTAARSTPGAGRRRPGMHSPVPRRCSRH